MHSHGPNASGAGGQQPTAAVSLQRAIALHQAGNTAEAEHLYRAILGAQPTHFGALHFLGVLEGQRGHFEEALRLLGLALWVNPAAADTHVARADVLNALGWFDEAEASCDRALAIKPRYVEALYRRGVAVQCLHRHDEALHTYDKVLAIKPGFVQALHNRGVALRELRRLDEALASYDRALVLRPDFVETLNNRAVVLSDLARHDEALASCERALAQKPDFAEALNNRGVALRSLTRYEDALASYDRALAIKPDLIEALLNRGAFQSFLGRHDAAGADLARALALNAALPFAAGTLLCAQMHCCDWATNEASKASIVAGVRDGRCVAEPFEFLAIADSAADQLRCAQIWVRAKCPPAPVALWQGERYAHDRIRVAYLSADFHEHPMGVLMAGLFERHDRTRFETIAVSFGPDTPSPMRTRLQHAFERFIDVRHQSDREVAQMLRALEIDILVDRKGFTTHARTGILALRPAPIQLNYLAFPGTMGAPYIDYIVADAVVIPPEHRPFYAEHVVHLPDSYQVNDSQRRIAPRCPSRLEAGLPEAGFVFCSFNNLYKITPLMFGIWMRLLREVPGSVLWLLQGDAAASRNLRREAATHGVAPERLVFATRLAHEDHLARHALADLFLDTLPYNAHTTASDALWAGLPVLTCMGSTFAGRVAASLLQAIGLPELITPSHEDYAALALRLATDAPLLAGIRQRLADHRKRFPLFDTDRFRRHLEAAYVTMWERYQRGEPPADFAVTPVAPSAVRAC